MGRDINSIQHMSIIILMLSSGVINFMPKMKVTLIYAVSCLHAVNCLQAYITWSNLLQYVTGKCMIKLHDQRDQKRFQEPVKYQR